MRKQKIGLIGAGLLGLAMAATPASIAKVNNPVNQTEQNTSNSKATVVEPRKKRHFIKNEVGGMDLLTYYPNYGLSPKEYGMRYGHGNKKHKTNYLKLKHNAKLKRRKTS